jgi:membrane protein implicated in regulation of membrane protease activity
MWWWLLILAVGISLILAAWFLSRWVSRRAAGTEDLDRFRANQTAADAALERRRRAQSEVSDHPGGFMPGG